MRSLGIGEKELPEYTSYPGQASSCTDQRAVDSGGDHAEFGHGAALGGLDVHRMLKPCRQLKRDFTHGNERQFPPFFWRFGLCLERVFGPPDETQHVNLCR